jgi:large subunit ribosomal protein L22
VRLRGDKLKKLAAQQAVSVEQLAQAVAGAGLDPDKAVGAVRNWFAGRDQPRCRAEHIAALAQAVGRQPSEIARFTSEVRFHRGSPRKAKLVADMVRGKPVDEALNVLAFTPQRAAVNLRKALSAAISDAELADADVTELVVSESRVDGGPHLKRFQPKDRGRSHPILKRTSHLTISVQERD